MRQYELNGVQRNDTGKKAAKALRAEGLVPCVLLNNGQATTFTVKATDVRNLVYSSQVYMVNLNIDGKQQKAVVKEMQFNPVEENLLHIDFLAVEEDKPITVKIPVKLEGHAEGVKAGGKLVKQLRDLTVKGLWTNVPERLVIDVTNINLGKVMKVGECQFEGLEILTAKEAIVAAVRATRASRAAAGK
jgi:large subunit ribosomal protein L25